MALRVSSQALSGNRARPSSSGLSDDSIWPLSTIRWARSA